MGREHSTDKSDETVYAGVIYGELEGPDPAQF